MRVLNCTAWKSLQTRITLIVLAIFIANIWLLAFYAIRTLRLDMEHALGGQQFSAASLAAAQIDQALNERINALEIVAARIDRVLLAQPAALQDALEHYPVLHRMFNGGILAVRGDGMAVAEVPATAGRVGVNYMEQDSVAGALKEGKATIGRPTIGKKLQSPVFGTCVPIHDKSAMARGALCGVVNLGMPNVFGNFVGSPYGKSGGFLLVAPQYRLIVTATDTRRIMTSLPPPGGNAGIDRFIAGYEGSTVFTNPLGAELLASVKRVQRPGWYVAAQLPTEEAFAPIREVRRRVLLAAIGLTALAAALTWWTLRRQLAPMEAAVHELQDQARSSAAPRQLPIERRDEVGELIGGFNHVLEMLRQREAALRESTEILRLFVRHAPAAIAMFDREMRYITCSERWLADYRVGQQDILGRSLYEVSPGIPERWKELHRRCLAGVSEYCAEDCFVQADGSVEWVRWEAHPWTSSGGETGGIIIFAEILTMQRQAELKVRELSLAVEQTSESVVITNLDANIEYANEAFFRATGYDRGEVVGKNPRLLQSGKTPRATFEQMWQALGSGKSWRGELYNRRKDGREYIEVASVSPLRQPDGTITHYVAVKEDITERKQADEQLRRMSEDLRQLNETLEARIKERTAQLSAANLKLEALLGELERSNHDLEQFAYVASHDLQEPLRVVIGFARILEDEFAQTLNADAREYLGFIADGATRMQTLIQDILRYSRVAALGQQREPVDMSAVVREALAALGSQVRDAGAHVTVAVLPTVMGMRPQFVQLFQNLIGNALKFCAHAPPRVQIAARRDLGAWRFTVSDNGIGIDAQDRERIFVMFQRLHSRSAYPGTGIGLALCKKIVECHGGEIGVDAGEAGGSAFWFTIPHPEPQAP